ncbi:hypothetical protein ACWDA3_33330 [Nonomuraea rubra]
MGTLEGGNKAGYNYEGDPSSWCAQEGTLLHQVNAMAREWIEEDEPNHGLVLRALPETASINWRQYYSSEYSGDPYPGYRHPPTLIVEYTPAPKRLTMHPSVEEEVVTSEVLDQYVGDLTSTPQAAPARSWSEIQEEHRASNEVMGRNPDSFFTPPSDMPADQIVADLDPDANESADVPAEETILGHWSFDEGSGQVAADSSEFESHAMLSGTTTWTQGRSGSALTRTSNGSSAPVPAGVSRSTASQEAKKQGKPVEVTGETSETRITHALPDGSYKTEITMGPVRTRRSDVWVPIDTKLIEQGGSLKPKAISAGVSVEVSNGGDDAFVKMAAHGKSYALRWPTPLPKPIVKGQVATYTDAAGAGADLVVTVLPTGLRHEVVLRQRPSETVELRIGVDDDGLTLTEGRGGQLLLGARTRSWSPQGHGRSCGTTAARADLRRSSEAGPARTWSPRTAVRSWCSSWTRRSWPMPQPFTRCAWPQR